MGKSHISLVSWTGCEKNIRSRQYSPRTEANLGWIRHYVLFHDKRHPLEVGATEMTQFLSALTTRGRVSTSTQNHAFSALLLPPRERRQNQRRPGRACG